jgi:hypothetical protein
MNWLHWLISLPGRSRERPRAVAAFDEVGVTCRWPDGPVQSVTWDDLDAVEIRTTDWGPFVEDVYLMLHAGDDGCVVPQESEGFDPLLRRLQSLPGFDNGAICSAMKCTDNAVFPCWRRDDARSPDHQQVPS